MYDMEPMVASSITQIDPGIRHLTESSAGANWPGCINDFGGPDIPHSSSNRSAAPLAISIPRRGSLSSSFALATSPRAFASAGNPFLNPISPTSSSIPHPSPPPGPGILGRRFSVGFNPHSQIIPSSQDNPHGSSTAGATTAGGLFRKFSIGGGGGGGGGFADKNSTDDMHQPQPQQAPHSSIFATLKANRHRDSSSEQQHKQDHLTTVQHLKAPASQDKNSRSNSPMRSLILNGQMLD
ncbi:hypothetical protein BG005_000528 [Podila minutissima]|nr:hypothetical protein BG005_000528 [Podila minutissima]